MTDAPESRVIAAIEEAEIVTDPLDGLVEKAAVDPGIPFMPEVLEGLCALKRKDRAAFEGCAPSSRRLGVA